MQVMYKKKGMEYAFAKSIAFVLSQIIKVCNKMKILHIPNELHLNYEGKARWFTS